MLDERVHIHGQADKSDSPSQWENTQMVVDRLGLVKFMEESGEDSPLKFLDRPLISRDKPINGGIYPGSELREAIVVDDKKDFLLLQKYKELVEKVEGDGNQDILQVVYDFAIHTIPYNLNVIEQLRKTRIYEDKKILLSLFFGGGVCRHQALLTGYLLEKLIQDGLLKGTVSIDRNRVRNVGGHAWVRYEDELGEVSILDPAQGYYGKLSKIKKQHWFYERDEDIEKRKNPPKSKNVLHRMMQVFRSA